MVECKYSHCLHESRELPEEEAILSGKIAYYHKDCYEESMAIRDVIDIFYREVNKNVVMSNLRQVVNQIVYNKGCDAQFLKYALRYWLDHGKKLNYPAGLNYVIQDKDARKAWQEKINGEFKRTIDKNAFIGEDKKGEKIENYKPKSKSSFINILGRS